MKLVIAALALHLLFASPARPRDIAPDFTAREVGGKPVRLAKLRGKPVTLFVFCGCEACHKIAKEWTGYARDRVLPAGSGPTIAAYMGDRATAIAFAQETGLPKTVTLIPDRNLEITQKYGVAPCPRVFVIDAVGRVRYTNNHSDDRPQKAAPALITGRALQALRQLAPEHEGAAHAAH